MWQVETTDAVGSNGWNGLEWGGMGVESDCIHV